MLDAKDELSEIVHQPDDFDFRGFNLFKVFFTHNTIERQFIHAQLVQIAQLCCVRKRSIRFVFRRGREAMKTIGKAIIFGLRNRRRPSWIFYGSSGRVSEIDGVLYDLYNPRLVESRELGTVVLVEDARDGHDKLYPPDFCLSELGLPIGIMRLVVKSILGTELRNSRRKSLRNIHC